jgi:hypothetical protein
MLGKDKKFPTSYPVIYWAQSVEHVLVKILLHPEMDTPICKQSFEKNVKIERDTLRVSAYCMQFVKNNTQGIAKKENAGDEKEWDLDRKRDDESIIDV